MLIVWGRWGLVMLCIRDGIKQWRSKCVRRCKPRDSDLSLPSNPNIAVWSLHVSSIGSDSAWLSPHASKSKQDFPVDGAARTFIQHWLWRSSHLSLSVVFLVLPYPNRILVDQVEPSLLEHRWSPLNLAAIRQNNTVYHCSSSNWDVYLLSNAVQFIPNVDFRCQVYVEVL